MSKAESPQLESSRDVAGHLPERRTWIAWEDDTSIRSRVLAGELGARYHPFTRFTDSRYLGWLRYPVATLQTTWTLLRRRPDLLVVQNPSILLAFEAALLRPLLGYRLVIDLHTPFSDPRGLSKLIADALHGFALRHCDAVIVTNESYRQKVRRQTDTPVFVLPDKVPELPGAPDVALRGRFNVLYICTFSEDEPWREVLAAAPLLDEDTCIYISGRSPVPADQVPDNVVLTGYLPRQEYQDLLNSVDAVMVLTSAEDNLVCGGYEGVAVGKPLVLSDTAALRSLFRMGSIYTQNSAVSIASALAQARGAAPSLQADVARLRTEMAGDWQDRWARLLGQFGSSEPRRVEYAS